MTLTTVYQIFVGKGDRGPPAWNRVRGIFEGTPFVQEFQYIKPVGKSLKESSNAGLFIVGVAVLFSNFSFMCVTFDYLVLRVLEYNEPTNLSIY